MSMTVSFIIYNKKNKKIFLHTQVFLNEVVWLTGQWDRDSRDIIYGRIHIYM